VVSEDLRVSQIYRSRWSIVVGKFCGHRVSMSSINSWTQQEWAPLIGYGPIVHLLAHGWLGFIFRRKDDALQILKGCWFMDKNILSIKPWHPLFDAREEFEASTPVWVKLPNLPIEFWSDSRLKVIGDALGNFITVDDSYKYSSSCLVAHILVEIDI
jgi:hypothetical protein